MLRRRWLFAFGAVLSYTAADVDDMATDDFLMLCRLLERHEAAQATELAKLGGQT